MAEEEVTGEEEELLPHEALYNSVRIGTFVERTDEGFVFDVDEGQKAFVGEDDLGADVELEAGAQRRLLVERPYGKYWAASFSKVEKLELWERMEALFESGETVEGRIVAENKGGLSVDIGLRAFVPRSQIDVHRVDDCSPYIGRRERFRVIKFDHQRCNVVLSRRVILEEEREGQRDELVANLEKGQVYEGVVRNVVEYGAFVDIGGIEGLLHASNMSWGRVDHPSELFRPGDLVRVVVLEYDAERDRLSLGRKQLLDDPWEEVEERYSEGDVVQGKVVSLADFGAFVELEPGLDGLVHVTELSWTKRINHPKEVLDIGAEVGVKVIGIDTEKRRLSLSIKRLERNPWEVVAEELSPGTKTTGRIVNITDFGLFVELVPNIDGLVHVSDLSWTDKIDDPAEHYEVGDEIEVVVIEIDPESTRASLGVKQLTDDPWELAERVAEPGKKIDVRITRIEDFGAFAEVVEGVEGLIHISELAEERVERVTDVVRPGQEVEVLVTSFDRSNQRIGLSFWREHLDDQGAPREYDDEEEATATLGDILRDRLGMADEADDAPVTLQQEVDEDDASDVDESDVDESDVDESDEVDEGEDAGPDEPREPVDDAAHVDDVAGEEASDEESESV